MKSDNANGLFSFTAGQSLERQLSETVGNVSFTLQRSLGFRGEVTVSWMVFAADGSRASDDFVQSSGSLQFADGQKEAVSEGKKFTVLLIKL